jgi:serine-type D-Ala-D-Ala carboxypeptidase/endopeptidase
MRRLLLVAVLAAPAQAEDWNAVVDKPAGAVVKDRKYATVVVGVLDGDREQVFAFGEWDGKAPDRDSVYEIGSVTKVFTGTLLADRVKAGVVKLDDPVQKHLPDGWTMPRRDDRDITLLHLATHTSGLPRMPNGFLAAALLHPADPFAHFDEATLTKYLPGTKLQYAIGAHHEYSNLGVGLLGHALAHASGADGYGPLLSDRVLKPLGLTDTGIALTEAQKKRVIPGHDSAGKPQPNWDFATLGACGAMRSTVGDLLRFVKANADPSGPLRDALVTAQQNWRDVRPGAEEIGLCWVRFPGAKKEPPKVWHNGQTGGYHSFVGFVPGRGGVVVLCNVTTFDVDKVGLAVLNKLAEAK